MLWLLGYGIAGLLVQCFAEYVVWSQEARRLNWMESLKVGVFWPFAAGWMVFVTIKTLRH